MFEISPRIFLADPYLTGYSGHCYSYLNAMRRAMIGKGLGCHVIGNAVCTGAFCEEANIVAGFSSVVRERGLLPGFGSRAFVRDLDALTERFAFGPDCLLVINSLRQFRLEALAQWLARLPAVRRPKVAAILHFSDFEPRWRDRYGYAQAFKALAALPAQTIRLLADTEELIDELQPLSEIAIGLAPIPPGLSGLSLPVKPLPVDQRKQRLTVAFAGEARWDKGFHLLSAAAVELSSDIAEGRVDFVVQAHNPEKKSAAFLQTIANLRRHRVRMFEAALSPTDYEHFLSSADILLLPYSSGHYRTQSSGVFVEALVAGKIVVAPAETWMGKQILKDGGGVTYPLDQPDLFRRSVREALDRFTELRVVAEHNATKAHAFHNADYFADILLGATE